MSTSCPSGWRCCAKSTGVSLQLYADIHVNQSDYIHKGQHSPLRDDHPEGAEVTIRELLRLAVSESNGSASDVLLRLIGGPPAVMTYLHDLGIDDVQVLDTEKRIGEDDSLQYRNWATPSGAIKILRALHKSAELSRSSRALLLQFMTETTTFPTRIKGLLPTDAAVAHKTGSSGTSNGITAATNDIGIMTLPDGREMAIAVFVADSKANDTTRDNVIARIAKQAWDAAAPKRSVANDPVEPQWLQGAFHAH